MIWEDVCIPTPGNRGIIMAESMKNNAIVGDIGHSD